MDYYILVVFQRCHIQIVDGTELCDMLNTWKIIILPISTLNFITWPVCGVCCLSSCLLFTNVPADLWHIHKTHKNHGYMLGLNCRNLENNVPSMQTSLWFQCDKMQKCNFFPCKNIFPRLLLMKYECSIITLYMSLYFGYNIVCCV